MLIAVHVVVLFALYSHILERAEARNHRATDPCCVLSVQVCSHVDVCLNRSPSLFADLLGAFLSFLLDLLLKALGEAWKKGGASSKNNVVV